MCSHKAGHQFVIGRIVTGFGNGLNTATIPQLAGQSAPRLTTEDSIFALKQV